LKAVNVPFFGSFNGAFVLGFAGARTPGFPCETEGIAARAADRMRNNIATERIKQASLGVICRHVRRDSN